MMLYNMQRQWEPLEGLLQVLWQPVAHLKPLLVSSNGQSVASNGLPLASTCQLAFNPSSARANANSSASANGNRKTNANGNGNANGNTRGYAHADANANASSSMKC